jgi:hypothetical protein
MFCWRQQERKLDVFFPAKKAQDVCRAVVNPRKRGVSESSKGKNGEKKKLKRELKKDKGVEGMGTILC